MGVGGSTQRLRPMVNPDGKVGLKVRPMAFPHNLMGDTATTRTLFFAPFPHHMMNEEPLPSQSASAPKKPKPPTPRSLPLSPTFLLFTSQISRRLIEKLDGVDGEGVASTRCAGLPIGSYRITHSPPPVAPEAPSFHMDST